MTATVKTFPDLDALSNAAADALAALARGKTHPCHVALSGGSTPKRLFEVLAARGPNALPWDRVILWWGDERTVPPDHPDSNYGMAKRTLIDPLHLDPSRIHRMEGERDPAQAAADYERQLVSAIGSPPVFDIVLLGLGPDGHVASLFPGSPGLAEKSRWVVANPVDSPVAGGKTTRITLTLPAINSARAIWFLVSGEAKAHRVKDVLDGPPGLLPAQHVMRATWFLDAGAAQELR